VNPVAANVTGRSRRAVLDALVVHAVSLVETTEPDYATALAGSAAADGVDVVVVLGRGESVARHPAVDIRRDQPRLVVRGHDPFPWQADGDYQGETTELVLTQASERLVVVDPLC